MNLIIAGGRDFKDYDKLEKVMKTFIERNGKPTTVICGMARGADRLGRRYALEHGIRVLEMPADWDLYKKSAGYRRNVEMAKAATHCICFWDGESKGTKHMIDIAMKEDLCTMIVEY